MLSRYFYHGLNGQLCPEYFQKGPRNFGFSFAGGSLCLAVAASSFFPRCSVFLLFFDIFVLIVYLLGHFLFLGIELCAQRINNKKKLSILCYGGAASSFFQRCSVLVFFRTDFSSNCISWAIFLFQGIEK